MVKVQNIQWKEGLGDDEYFSYLEQELKGILIGYELPKLDSFLNLLKNTEKDSFIKSLLELITNLKN